MSNRLANERLVTDPRRAVILVDLAATLAILPVPIITPLLRHPVELLLREVGTVTPKADVIAQSGPGDGIIVAANAQEATKTKWLSENDWQVNQTVSDFLKLLGNSETL